jgi:hypothetical protein
MPAPVSTWPSVKSFLFAQITALPVCAPPVLVVYNDPLGDLEEDVVVVGQVTRQIEPGAIVGSLGAGSLFERYTVDVTVSCFRGGDNPLAADTQCAALVGAVIEVVRADLTLGGRVLKAWPRDHVLAGRSVTDEGGQSVMGYATECVVPIECYTQI